MRIPVLVTAFSLVCAVGASAQQGGVDAEQAPNDRSVASRGPDVASIEVKRISGRCYLARRGGGLSNAGFVVGDRSVLVVDCFEKPAVAEKLLEAVREVTTLPVKHVVLTHAHYDHCVGDSAMPDDATIIASLAAGEHLRERVARDRLMLQPTAIAHGSLDFTNVRLPDEAVAKDLELDLGGVRVLLATVGRCHSPGDLVVIVPQEKVLFAGDLVWGGLHPNLSGGETFRWIDVLMRLEKLDFRHVLPGHGTPGDRELLAKQRQYLMDLRVMVKHLARQSVDAEQILEEFEVPEAYAALGNRGLWQINLRHVMEELANQR